VIRIRAFRFALEFPLAFSCPVFAAIRAKLVADLNVRNSGAVVYLFGMVGDHLPSAFIDEYCAANL
jgi:hypothetical protein